jgi:hypothetical protein
MEPLSAPALSALKQRLRHHSMEATTKILGSGRVTLECAVSGGPLAPATKDRLEKILLEVDV